MDVTPTGRWLDLDGWARRDTFEFFLLYEQPLTNVCSTVDVSCTLKYCKSEGISFFLASWFFALRAACSVENFRMRLRDKRVFIHDRLYLSTTVLRDDETFGFSHIPLVDSFAEFCSLGQRAITAAKARDLPLDVLESRDDAIYGTTLPWIRLTGITHAHRIPACSSVPKVVFGKYEQHGERLMMPVAVEVHHALCDGLHIARFFQAFETMLSAPETYLVT
jgi:chloramphenicol O-acetyltransferase type A